jgi:hypothetical protein
MLYIQSGRMILFRNLKIPLGITVQQVIDWDFGYHINSFYEDPRYINRIQ